jgi:hypothetical protein
MREMWIHTVQDANKKDLNSILILPLSKILDHKFVSIEGENHPNLTQVPLIRGPGSLGGR